LFSAGTMKVEGGTDFSLNSDAFESIERAIGTASSFPTARM
jgi:hypothetical protein